MKHSHNIFQVDCTLYWFKGGEVLVDESGEGFLEGGTAVGTVAIV
jgi:hypothetical protein